MNQPTRRILVVEGDDILTERIQAKYPRPLLKDSDREAILRLAAHPFDSLSSALEAATFAESVIEEIETEGRVILFDVFCFQVERLVSSLAQGLEQLSRVRTRLADIAYERPVTRFLDEVFGPLAAGDPSIEDEIDAVEVRFRQIYAALTEEEREAVSDVVREGVSDIRGIVALLDEYTADRHEFTMVPSSRFSQRSSGRPLKPLLLGFTKGREYGNIEQATHLDTDIIDLTHYRKQHVRQIPNSEQPSSGTQEAPEQMMLPDRTVADVRTRVHAWLEKFPLSEEELQELESLLHQRERQAEYIPASELQHIGRLLSDVIAGRRFVIQIHGEPTVMLLPYDSKYAEGDRRVSARTLFLKKGELREQASRGATIVISHRGKRVAVMCPFVQEG